MIRCLIAAMAVMLAAPAMAQPSQMYLDLRAMAFEASPQDIGLTTDEPYGLIVDWNVGAGVVTIVSFATGDASLYLDTGGGVIGGFAHERVRQAAQNAVHEGSGLTGLEPASRPPSLPMQEGEVTFTVLRPEGAWTMRAREDDLENPSHPAYQAWVAIHAVISELRRVAGP